MRQRTQNTSNATHKLQAQIKKKIIIITIIIINGLDKSNSYNIHRPAVNSVWSGGGDDVAIQTNFKMDTHTHTES